MLPIEWKKYRATKIMLTISDDLARTDIVKHAYAMAYVTLFSLIPSLAATLALVSLFIPMFGKNSDMIQQFQEFVLKNLATGSGEQALDYLQKFLANTDFKKIGMTGFTGTMVTLIFLLKQIEMALNRIFEIEHPRPLLVRFIYFWTFLTLGTFSLAVSIGTLSSSGFGAKYLEISLFQQILGDFMYFASMFAFFFLLYKVVPNRLIPNRQAIIGAATSTTLLSLAIKFFSLYISHFTSFQAVYGALSALPIFLLWLYIIWFITLFGAVITKRSMDGWQPEILQLEAHHEHIKDPFFQSLLPFLVLLRIYRYYDENAGKGAYPEDLAREFGVTLSPVYKALHLLQEQGLVLILKPEVESVYNRSAYFPRLPAQQVSYSDLKLKLLGAEDNWLKTSALPGSAAGRYSGLVQHFLLGAPHTIAEDVKY